jgi:kynurenine 3-monooxygenase
MVPFYGQGLNCGFEDVRVLDTIMRLHSVDPFAQVADGSVEERLAAALQEYSRSRHIDLVAISDLAMEN